MKLALSLAFATGLLVVGCGSDGGATPAVIEDDGGNFAEGGGGDETSTDATGDSPAGDTGTTPSDTGTTPTDTGTTPTDTGSDSGAAGKIVCGSAMCDPATQACCAGATTSCIAKAGSCPIGQSKYNCTQPTDCTGGAVCCAKALGGTGGAECAASCPTTNLCTTKADCKGGKNCTSIGAVKACI